MSGDYWPGKGCADKIQRGLEPGTGSSAGNGKEQKCGTGGQTTGIKLSVVAEDPAFYGKDHTTGVPDDGSDADEPDAGAGKLPDAAGRVPGGNGREDLWKTCILFPWLCGKTAGRDGSRVSHDGKGGARLLRQIASFERI